MSEAVTPGRVTPGSVDAPRARAQGGGAEGGTVAPIKRHALCGRFTLLSPTSIHLIFFLFRS